VIGKKLSEGKVEFVTRNGMVKEEVAAEEILKVLEERF
jgi:prolyl-tRNA synthetase